MKTPFSLVITADEETEKIIRERLWDLDINIRKDRLIPGEKTPREEISGLLKEKDELLNIINRSPAVVFLWTAEENWPVETVSENITQFGYTVEDFTSGRIIFSSIIHPGDLERVAFEVEYNSENNIDEFVQEYRILGKDKKVYWIEDFTHIRRNEDGEITHYQGIIIDTTDRRIAEDELRRSSAVLRGVIESPKKVVIFALDKKYRYRVFNENHRLTMKNIWGADIAVGKNILDYISNPDDREKARINFDRALSGESFTLIEEYGDTELERSWYEDIYNPIIDEKGDVIGLTVFLADITARKKMEEELKESEFRFKELFNSMHSGVAIYRAVDEGEDFVFVDFNHGAEVIENISKEDVTGRRVSEIFPGIKDFGLLEIFKKVWKTGEPEKLPTSLYHDESIISWRENYVFRLPSGEIVAIYDDITEAKTAEEALKRSEDRYRQLFESSPVSMWEEDFSEGKVYLDHLKDSGISDFRKYFDENPEEVIKLAGMAKVLDINRATIDLMKAKSKEEFIVSLPGIFTPQSIETFKEELITIAEGEVLFKGESTHKTLSGDTIDVIIHMAVAPGYESSFGRILISILDITERKKAERALAREKAKTEYIIDSLPGVFYIFSGTGEIIRWNKNFETMSGYSDEEIKEMKSIDFIDEKYRKQVSGAIKKAFSEGYAEVEGALATKDGRAIPVLLSAYGKMIDNVPYLLGTGLDITAAKEAQKEIEKLAAIVQHSGEFISIADMKGKMTFINKAGAEMTGIDMNEVSRHKILDLFADERKEQIISEVIPAMEDKGSWEGDLQYVNLKTGQPVDVHAMTFTIYDPETGDPLFLANVSLDITARKKAEKALAREKANVEYIIDSLPGMFYMFYMFDETGRFVRWNKNMETLTGYSEEEVAKMRPLEFIDDNYKEQISDAIKTAFSEGYADQEAVIVTKDGEKIPFFFSANRKIIDGTAYILGMGLDITKAKMAEEEIRKLASVVKHSGEMIALTNTEGIINFINEAGGRMIGVDVKDITRHHFMDFIPDHLKDKMNSEVLPTMINKGLWEGDLKYLNKTTGDFVDVHAMIFTINDPETGAPDYLANVSLNITDRKKAEAALKEVNKKLNLLGSITRHDILNQVTVAQGYMEILDVDGFLTKETELGEYCGKVMGAIETIKRQIMFTKDYKDLGEQSPEWYNVGKIIDRNYRNTGFQTVKLVNETDDLEVYADPLFEKVIYNLFDNAVKHGEKITTIKFSFKKSGEDMDLICEDDGVGIPDEVKEKIFRREYYKHTGLGLFLSREILSITGLSIEENGTPGEGARFVINIPKGLFRFPE